MEFSEWLKISLRRLDWSQRELSRQSGVSQSTISGLFAGKRPTGEVCRRLAMALGEPEEVPLRIAGYLSSEPEGDDPAIAELTELGRQLPSDQLREIIDLIRWKLTRL